MKTAVTFILTTLAVTPLWAAEDGASSTNHIAIKAGHERALNQEAHRHGVKVASDAHGAEGIKTSVRSGVDSIEHGSLIDDEGIALKHVTFVMKGGVAYKGP